ncbi:hypothetical protein BHYA_0003g01230 [Botrytis hyacinthi]|uniref:FAD-binding PCMH-type domain-containing protein n=1 Tax=Botrytis hyacinthi TaxID=278943 RepID=A0A4Z1H3Y6_9HELO|nr:hypothetical protein BHYA_0003g01230 [Botrytis hyacinthi]
MHNLNGINSLNYSSASYTGPAVHIGDRVQYTDLYPLAQKHGYRAVGGAYPGVGLAGGFRQGGGHGPLMGTYGVAADQVLEWEVVTATGQHLIISPTHHADLYWALSGGGGGNFAVVLSVKVRAYNDGPVAGAAFLFQKCYTTEVHVNFAESYDHWISQAETSNTSRGGQNIPRSTVQDNTTLPALIPAFRDITEGGTIFLTAANITRGNYTPNVILPTWRDALYAVAFLNPLPENAQLDDIRTIQMQSNSWQKICALSCPEEAHT